MDSDVRTSVLHRVALPRPCPVRLRWSTRSTGPGSLRASTRPRTTCWVRIRARLQGTDGVIVRAWHPDAVGAEALWPDGTTTPLAGDHGLFAAFVPGRTAPARYGLRFRFPDGNVWERDDPYRFLPTLGDVDLHLFNEGTHRRLGERLGARHGDGRRRGHGIRGGRRLRGACPSSATSAAGTAGSFRCGRSAARASSSCSCRTSARGRSTSSDPHPRGRGPDEDRTWCGLRAPARHRRARLRRQ